MYFTLLKGSITCNHGYKKFRTVWDLILSGYWFSAITIRLMVDQLAIYKLKINVVIYLNLEILNNVDLS